MTADPHSKPRAALLVLANVSPENEAEFNRWYDREHMRERIEIPGFLSAQRYMSMGTSRWKYLATYEVENIETLTSDVYRRALANQSAWSKSVLTLFRDPQRSVAQCTARIGYGTGAWVRLIRLRPAADKRDGLRRFVSGELLSKLLSENGIIEASLLEAEPSLSGPVAEYPKGGLEVLRPDDWILRVAGVRASVGEVDIIPRIDRSLVEAIEDLGSFDLLWSLSKSDLDEGNRA
jgi:hypothetical protein